MLTVDDAKALVPGSVRSTIDQAFVDKINAAVADPIEAEAIREGFVTYSHVLKEGKYKLEDYLSAVKYVAYKQMGLNNQDAYAKTFPQRWINLQATGKDPSPYVAMYHKGKLVNAIMEQSLIPIWLLHQDALSKAVRTCVQVMDSSQSDIARVQAANAVMTHLKRPEVAKVQLDFTTKVDGMEALTDAMDRLANAQVAAVISGSATAGTVVKAPLVLENEDVTDL